jgi:hypothetical protein
MKEKPIDSLDCHGAPRLAMTNSHQLLTTPEAPA